MPHLIIRLSIVVPISFVLVVVRFFRTGRSHWISAHWLWRRIISICNVKHFSIELGPRVLVDIRVKIRPIYKPKRITRYEAARLQISVSEPFIEQPCGVFLNPIALRGIVAIVRFSPQCLGRQCRSALKKSKISFPRPHLHTQRDAICWVQRIQPRERQGN